MSHSVSQWMYARVSKWVSSEWMGKPVSQLMDESFSQWMNACTSERVSERASHSANQWENNRTGSCTNKLKPKPKPKLNQRRRRSTIIGGSCHKYHFCRDKTVFCRDKSMRQKWNLWQLSPLILNRSLLLLSASLRTPSTWATANAETEVPSLRENSQLSTVLSFRLGVDQRHCLLRLLPEYPLYNFYFLI